MKIIVINLFKYLDMLLIISIQKYLFKYSIKKNNINIIELNYLGLIC